MTEPSISYLVALFNSVSHVLQAEKTLKEAQVPHKIIPVPRKISSDCGVCIKILLEHREVFENTLKGKVAAYTIRPL